MLDDEDDDDVLPWGADRKRRVTRPPKVFEQGESIASKYTLTKLIGEGCMGQVWRAHSATLDIDVAVKVIRRDLVDEHASKRLLQEARAAARLGHPGIVRMMDCGVSGEDPYIVMELLEGESLGVLLERKKRLPPARAVRTLLPVMAALVVAHERGIVHRDLKPDNVLICGPSGSVKQPKLVDFGIAKLINRQGPSITTVGTLVGSPSYMSPEQARGETDVDARTDVWAMSVMLYEAIVGRLPFEAHTPAELFLLVKTAAAPAPVSLGVDDEGLWPIIERGLGKEPDDRWPSMQAYGEALAKWATSRGMRHDITGASIEAHWMGGRGSIDAELSDVLTPSLRAEVLQGLADAPVDMAATMVEYERTSSMLPPEPRFSDVVAGVSRGAAKPEVTVPAVDAARSSPLPPPTAVARVSTLPPPPKAPELVVPGGSGARDERASAPVRRTQGRVAFTGWLVVVIVVAALLGAFLASRLFAGRLAIVRRASFHRALPFRASEPAPRGARAVAPSEPAARRARARLSSQRT